MKKISFILILIFISLLLSCTANISGEIDYIVGYYAKNSAETFWDISALCYAGEDMTKYNIEPFLTTEVDESDYSALSGKVIGLKMLESTGYDISQYNSDHYIEVLQKLTEDDDANGYSLPILQRLYGIYALKLAGTSYSEENIHKFAEHVLTYQQEDGGFSTFSDIGDVDTTSFVIPLLIYLRDDNDFASAVSKASIYLRNTKNSDDTYSSFGASNSNTTASALSALMALGFTEKDADIGDISLALATFRLPDGSYSHQMYGNTNKLSCAQSLIAYCDFANKDSLWLSVLRGEFTPKNVTLNIVGLDGDIKETHNIAISKNETAFDIFAKVCKKENIIYTIRGTGAGVYIVSVNNVGEFEHGPESGWIYTVNGESISVGCNSYVPANNDVIEFKYITEYEDNI